MRRTCVFSISSLFIVFLFFTPLSVVAHKASEKRGLRLQVDDGVLIGLWNYRPKRASAQSLGKLYDLNRDGQLNDAEKKMVLAALFQKAKAGVRLSLGPRVLELSALKLEVSRGSDWSTGRVEILGLAEYFIGQKTQDNFIQIAVAAGYPGMRIELYSKGKNKIEFLEPVISSASRLKQGPLVIAGGGKVGVTWKGHRR
ncbi:MAG: hypothetical protein VYA34_07075 [Myxococcota bacterium]|nr:hypothetical protein [Myxococcota bacterium]